MAAEGGRTMRCAVAPVQGPIDRNTLKEGTRMTETIGRNERYDIIAKGMTDGETRILKDVARKRVGAALLRTRIGERLHYAGLVMVDGERLTLTDDGRHVLDLLDREAPVSEVRLYERESETLLRGLGIDGAVVNAFHQPYRAVMELLACRLAELDISTGVLSLSPRGERFLHH